jgi:hypothetical protein
MVRRTPKRLLEDQELPDVPGEDLVKAYEVVRPGEDVRAAAIRVQLAHLDRDFWPHLGPAARAACEDGRLARIIVAFCHDSWWACRDS